MSITIRCPHCGKEIPITSQYCLGCGSTEVQNKHSDYLDYLNSQSYTTPSYTAPSYTEPKPYKQSKSIVKGILGALIGIPIGYIIGLILGFIFGLIYTVALTWQHENPPAALMNYTKLIVSVICGILGFFIGYSSSRK